MLGKLIGKLRKAEEKKDTQTLVSPAIRDSILSTVGARSIPTMPAAAQKAFELATDPNAEARNFIEVIESDEGLSGRVLKIANSVYFDRGKQSETIEEAVMVIGINELRCLLNATTLSEIFPSSHPARNQLWANDIATAIIARTLAGRFLPSKQDSAFLGGLMHDIGKLLLLQRAGEDYSRAMKIVEETGCDFSEAETQIFIFDHAEVGALIGEKWNFSPELSQMIGLHHKPWEVLIAESAGTPTLPTIIKAADTIAHALGLGHAKGFNRKRLKAQEELEHVWTALNLPEDDRKSFLSNCERAFNTEHDLYVGKAF